MENKKEARRDLDTKLKGVMEFYVNTYFEYFADDIKEEAAKHNVFLETDIMEARMDDSIRKIVDESSSKFHDVCMLILDTVMSGREHLVREFEVLFLDLVKRTLLKEMKEMKQGATPIVIISDPGVKAKEN